MTEKPYLKNSKPDSPNSNRGIHRSQEVARCCFCGPKSTSWLLRKSAVKRVADLGLIEETVFMFSSHHDPYAEGGPNPAYF
ncbi:MAG: hypothetical protein ACI8UX_001921 [Psychromonas sp.]